MSMAFDTWVLFVRSIKKLVRTPILLFFSLFQPIIFLVLFTQLFGRFGSFVAAGCFVGVSYLSYATPGILLQNAFSSALQSGTSVVDDINSGFLAEDARDAGEQVGHPPGAALSDAFRVSFSPR